MRSTPTVANTQKERNGPGAELRVGQLALMGVDHPSNLIGAHLQRESPIRARKRRRGEKCAAN